MGEQKSEGISKWIRLLLGMPAFLLASVALARQIVPDPAPCGEMYAQTKYWGPLTHNQGDNGYVEPINVVVRLAAIGDETPITATSEEGVDLVLWDVRRQDGEIEPETMALRGQSCEARAVHCRLNGLDFLAVNGEPMAAQASPANDGGLVLRQQMRQLVETDDPNRPALMGRGPLEIVVRLTYLGWDGKQKQVSAAELAGQECPWRKWPNEVWASLF